MRTKLLLADDSITIQKVVGIIFASEDYELAIVDNGAAALAKAREFMPDLFLVDAVMPGMTGYEVCEEVRRDSALRGVPILLLTGAFEPFDDEKAKTCGADDYISKPFESQALIDKVSELVDLGRQSRVASPAPASRPAAPPPPVQPETFMPAPPPTPHPATAPAIPAVQTLAADAGIFSMDTEPLETPAPTAFQAAAPEFEFEMVEGTTEDDLWGAFDLKDEAEGAAADFDESVFAVEPLAGEETVAEDVFGFADEAETTPPALPDSGEGFAAQWGPDNGSDFSFAEEEPPGFAALDAEQNEFTVEVLADAPEDISGIAAYAPPAEQEFDLLFAPEEESVPASMAPTTSAPPPPSSADNRFDLQFAPDEEFMPSQESLTPFAASPAPVPPPADLPESFFAPEGEFVPAPETLAPVAPPPAPASTPAAPDAPLSEEQLSALVSRISRDIIEKIAWEVVPDLAEIIIKDEIRKIKEGS